MNFPTMWLRGNTNYPIVSLDCFKAIKKLGRGRYGMCYLAQASNGELVVIKRLRTINFERTLDNIQYEVTMLYNAQCDRIPKVIGIINEKNFKGFVMEFIKGETLAKLIKVYEYKFTRKEIYTIMIQLLDIVREVHEAGIVHRDIRTPNIIINDGDVYLIDFGLSRWHDYENCDYDMDFSFIATILITLLGTRLSEDKRKSELEWEEMLGLTKEQKDFLNELLNESDIYEDIYEVESEFKRVFPC